MSKLVSEQFVRLHEMTTAFCKTPSFSGPNLLPLTVAGRELLPRTIPLDILFRDASDVIPSRLPKDFFIAPPGSVNSVVFDMTRYKRLTALEGMEQDDLSHYSDTSLTAILVYTCADTAEVTNSGLFQLRRTFYALMKFKTPINYDIQSQVKVSEIANKLKRMINGVMRTSINPVQPNTSLCNEVFNDMQVFANVGRVRQISTEAIHRYLDTNKV